MDLSRREKALAPGQSGGKKRGGLPRLFEGNGAGASQGTGIVIAAPELS